MKIVLDSNILLVALGQRSEYAPIWQAFIDKAYQLVVTEDIIFEYTEILQQRSAIGMADLILDVFIESSSVLYQQVYYNWNLIKDPDDNKFFDAAVAANVDYLVTNDKHFNTVKSLKFPPVNVVTGKEFLAILSRT
jgi:putative PIN family toxin of toxin-antitoxin system